MDMKKKVSIVILRMAALVITGAAFASCATRGGSGDGLSLDEAIERSAAELAVELPDGIRVVIAAFSSEHENLSAGIMDRLAGSSRTALLKWRTA
jgi:hypothetical protein